MPSIPLRTTACAAALSLAQAAQGGSVTTEFDTSDGFVTSPVNGAAPAPDAFEDVVLSDGGFSATFSGGQQQQMFDGPSYNNGPAAYLFVNTGPGAAVFTGASGNTITGGANNGDQTGSISFSTGATEVSFFAADRANGPASTLDIFDTGGNLLLEDFVIDSGVTADQFFSFNSADLGGLIGEITFDLPGPAANAPYVLAIDTFSAVGVADDPAVIPTPSAVGGGLAGLALLAARRRRR